MAALLSAREAALSVGVSERTVRNWISSGKLPAERTSEGFRIRSEDLSGKASTTVGNRSATSGKNGTLASVDLSGLVALVRELIPKAEAAAMWQARAEFLGAQLEQAQLALAAPKEADSPEMTPQRDSEHVAVDPPQQSSAPGNGRPRAWWRWW